MKYFPRSVSHGLIAISMLLALTVSTFGQEDELGPASTKSVADAFSAPNASVDPVVFDGQNIDCADLNALFDNGQGDLRFSHIILDYELRLDFSTPNGIFPYTSGGPPDMTRIVVGPEDGTKSVTISSSSDPAIVHSWSSQIPITAVIVKVGDTSYVYPYKPFATMDTDLNTGDPRGISHVTFCFAEPTNPTAGDGSISGRVVDSSGFGIARARLILINGTTGEAKITMTNPFGFYSFQELDVNELFVLNVSHKRFAFPEKQRTVSLLDNLTDVNFVGTRMY